MVMATNLGKVSLFGRRPLHPSKARGWTSQDIADLYWIAEQLTQLGFPVSTQTGQSDEGDPWAVLERHGTGEVVVHLARIDGELIVADVVRERTYRGSDFRSLAEKLMADAPLTLPRIEDRGNVVLHPRMVMIAFVAAAFVLSEFAAPSAAEAEEFEGDASVVPQPKADQGQMESSSAPLNIDLVDKTSARDGLGGMGAAQITALTAGLYALSLHLMPNPDVIEGQVGVPESAELEQTSSLDNPTYAPFTLSPLFENPNLLVLSAKEPDTLSLVEDTPVQGEADMKSIARLSVESDANSAILSIAVSLQVQDDTTFEVPAIAFKQSSYKQDSTSQVSVSDGPTAEPTIALSEQSISAVEVFNLVSASVIVVDKSWLPVFNFDGDVEGAVVVRSSDFSDTGINVAELASIPALLAPEANMPLDAILPPIDFYLLVGELSQSIHLTPDLSNILIYASGDVEVSGFTFGRDSIVFIEDFTPLDWLESVNVVDLDVVLVGQGGSVTLLGAVETFE